MKMTNTKYVKVVGVVAAVDSLEKTLHAFRSASDLFSGAAMRRSHRKGATGPSPEASAWCRDTRILTRLASSDSAVRRIQ